MSLILGTILLIISSVFAVVLGTALNDHVQAVKNRDADAQDKAKFAIGFTFILWLILGAIGIWMIA